MDLIGSTDNEELITARKRGDTFPRFAVEADGSIKIGEGSFPPTDLSGRFAPLEPSAVADDKLVLISGQAHESPVVTNCTLSAGTNAAIGARSHRMTMSGATTATLRLQYPTGPIAAGGANGIRYSGMSLMIWLDNPASIIPSITVDVYRDSGLVNRHRFSTQGTVGVYSTPLRAGWNLIRIPAEYRRDIEVIGGDLDAVWGARVVVSTNAATFVEIGWLALEMRPKASMLFIVDGAFSDFFGNTSDGYAYASLKARNIPVTIAPDVIDIGTKADHIGEARLRQLSRENRNSVGFHGYTSNLTSGMTATQVIDETVKAQQWLAQRGYSGRMWRAAWMQNNAPQSPATDPLVLANAMYGANGLEVMHMWPFSDPSHVFRHAIHGVANNAELDAWFVQAERSRPVWVCYTHNVNNTPGPVDMTPAEWDYFISKVDEGIAAGWLEGVTFEMLMERSGLTPQKGLDGNWTVNYPDATGALVRRRLI